MRGVALYFLFLYGLIKIVYIGMSHYFLIEIMFLDKFIFIKLFKTIHYCINEWMYA